MAATGMPAGTVTGAHDYLYNEFHHPEAPLAIALWVFALGPITDAGSRRRLIARNGEVCACGRCDPACLTPTHAR